MKKMLDKEIPYDKIGNEDKAAFDQAIQKEWDSWLRYESCKILSVDESQEVEKQNPRRILPSRLVLRNKHAGLVDVQGKPLPMKAKARLCIAGHLCPDAATGELQVDSPTIERISTMVFLNMVICSGWLDHWFIGDISNAFLQGAPLEGEPMFMRQPKQGLPGLKPGQLIQLVKSVYGRPDAPRSWFNELSRILVEEIGFERSQIDPALFYLRDGTGVCKGVLVVHVDDLMVGGDKSDFTKQAFERLHKRFPFGTWQEVAKETSGVTYCGKEIKVVESLGERMIELSQNGFIDGRLDKIEIKRERLKDSNRHATAEELTDYRSAVGSLQWLSTQSRPDIAFEVNQLQKRVKDLRVFDLLRANRVIKEVVDNRFSIKFRNLGKTELVAFHDASLFNSVGVEINEQEADDILMTGKEKKLVYSQKGAVLGLVSQGDIDKGEPVKMNILDWRSTTNKRVIESSLAAETHAAIQAHGLSRFVQALLAEATLGTEVVSYLDDEDWQSIAPLNMITDCKSIYDHVRKDGQHLSEKGNVIQVMLLRKMCSTRPHTGKARLLWVPTRNQLADGLTKTGRGKHIRENLGEAKFHEEAAPRRKWSTAKDSYASVN